MFELTDKSSISELSSSIAPAIEFLKSNNRQLIIFSRALRQSFLKGFELVKRLSALVDIMAATETDDAVGFLVIIGLLGYDDIYTSLENNNRLYRNISRITPKGLVLLARDLRRTVPHKSSTSAISYDEATSWLKQLHGSMPDRKTSLAKCLVLHYTNSFDARMIIWAKRNHQGLGLEGRDVVSLSALAGYDVPFVIDINKGLFGDGFKHKITSPSKCRFIADYFNKSLVSWKAIPCDASLGLNISSLPLVTVIFTTYSPDIKLFELSLDSVLNQTYPALEVIIIDDHSPVEFSNSLKTLIESLRPNHPHSIIYKRNESNVGQYVSRNLAIAMAKGAFIAIQDDDDISHPERLQKQIEPMLMNSTLQATHAWHIRISESARIMSDGDALGEIPGDAPVSFVWRKRVFDEIGSFLPTKTRGDIEFRTRLRRHYGNDAILAVPHPLVIMRGGMGTVSADKEYYYRSALSALRYMMTHIPSGIVESEDMQRYIPSLLQ